MNGSARALVANTDKAWFDHFRPEDRRTEIDEVNFWRPLAQDHVHAGPGEHALPVLDSAHIQPYVGPASNHVQNGLVLRTDLHRLYDGGYLTVTPDYRLEVSHRLRDEFDNGKAYYEMQGRPILLPKRPELRPCRAALLWHAERVFR